MGCIRLSTTEWSAHVLILITAVPGVDISQGGWCWLSDMALREQNHHKLESEMETILVHAK